ncbi:MAG: HAD-IB family hydrolase [Enterobacteriaceae bacterium]|jgi:HAD superfamily hydrolase (TIGR01490 family)|nr:HAD-IB family hydrolase [Enterobacteriaceae bacterium]
MGIAFFDFDETVITGKSMFIFLKEYLECGEFSCGLSFTSIMNKIQKNSNEGKPREDINRYYYSLFKGESQNKVRATARKVFSDGCYDFNTIIVKKILFHQMRNDDVVFVSGSMTDIIYPVMQSFGIRNALCSEPIIKNGYYTGALSRVSIGNQKAKHARSYAQTHHQPLSACYAYGDHISDLDLLRLVGHPYAVNPSPELMTECQRQGWPILYESKKY